MTSSSNPPLVRGLDMMILVNSLLRAHPAILPWRRCQFHERRHLLGSCGDK
jgi:hypothetical protein